jgi:sirohydrochlorin ferrochelatase
MTAPLTLLVDNGSLEPAATLRLRELAVELAGKIGAPVAPVSLRYSSAIAPARLQGVPAETLEPALARRLAAGQTEFIIVPVFFGPSWALTGFLPARVALLRREHPALRVRLAPPLFAAGDHRLARILADQVRAAWPAAGPRRVALVDHGSPTREVTAVRDALAGQLAKCLGEGALVAPCSMERRTGPEYDFNEPLLGKLLTQPEWQGDVVVAMQFLLPGRHAGAEGDVAQICRRAEAARPDLRTHLTPLVGEHPALSGILADRWRTAGQGI